MGERDGFVRADWEYESRNPWLANMQDPHNDATYNYGYSYTLPSTNFVSARAGLTLANDLQLALFCDNLFDSHTVTNYTLGQTDGTYTPQPQMVAGHEVTPDGRTWLLHLRDGLRVIGLEVNLEIQAQAARIPVGAADEAPQPVDRHELAVVERWGMGPHPAAGGQKGRSGWP
jgi:hypothetical protein